MPAVDVAAMLAGIAADAPCGPNLEYDPEFTAFERSLQGKPEVQYGDTLIAAEPPDWKAVRAQALALLARTRDLRIAVPLARALLATDGLPGLVNGLELLAGLLQTQWAAVHPQLDPDDGNDPTMRVNTLAGLCDADGLLRELRETPLVASRAYGRFSLRHLDLATAESPPEGQPTLADIEAAFSDAPVEELQASAAALRAAAELATRVEQALQEQVGAAQALDLAPLRSLAQRALAALDERLARRGVVAAAAGGAVAAATVAAGAAAGGEVRSRDDVLRMIDRICEYYRQAEPSSPVPLMLKRAQRLVPMGFREIIAELAPDGLPQVEKVLGAGASDAAG